MRNMRKYFIIFLAVLLVFDCSRKSVGKKYRCAMHPSVVSDKPGTCPICNMDLVPFEEKKENKTEDHKNHNPDDHRDHKSENSAGHGSDDHKGHEKKENSHSDNEKKIHIPEHVQAEFGIRTVQVKKSQLNRIIHSAGTVAYEPELYSALMEYRESFQLGASFSNAGRMKLEQMGLSESFIREWISRDLSELITGGKRGTAHIVSILYENEFSAVKPGNKVKITAGSVSGKVFEGTVRHVDKIPDVKTRTLKLRIEVKDRENLLKPQMFVKAEISSDFGEGLTVPLSAVIDTGERQIVYVRKNSGEFVQRDVRTGGETGSLLEIREGLAEGEEVVEYGIFFVDSESRLKSSPESSGGHKHD